MFSYVKKTLGVITVIEKDNNIYVEGVPGYFIEKDISTIWKTSKITANMFNKITRNTFSIPSFFALDLVYILEAITKHRRVGVNNARTARKLIDALFEHTWLSNINIEKEPILDFKKINLFYKTPLEFQMSFLEKYNSVVPKYNLNGYLLAGAAGSGKTYTGMVLAECRHADHVIVICPGNAVYRVWESSILNEYKEPPSYWIAGENKPYTKQKYLIAHYEALNKMLDVAGMLDGRIVIILDESHNLNEITAQRTQLFLELCRLTKSKDIVWASGTPIKALGSESISLFSSIDSLFTDDVKDRFKKMYGKDAKKAIDILNNRFNLVTHKIEKKELNLKEPIIENVAITTPDSDKFTLDSIRKDMQEFIKERNDFYEENKKSHYEFYDKCISFYSKTLISEKDIKELDLYKKNIKLIQTTELRFVKEESIFCNKLENTKIMQALPQEWRKEFKNVKSVVKYVQLKIQGECLGRVLGKKRMECILSISNNFDYVKYIESTAKKTLIFTSYVDVLENCKNKLIELGLNPLAVYGKTNNELNSIITLFDKDENINPLVATYPSLSTAVPLVMADTMIMLNAPFRDYIHQQAISRIHRLGSDTQVYVYIAYLDTGTKPNLSSRTIDILKWSQEQVAAITGIKSPFEIEELGISTEGIDSSNSLDYGVCFEELGIHEKFEFDVYIKNSNTKPAFLNW